MPRRRTTSQRLDPTRPVNWAWPGNYGLVAEWAAAPLPYGFGGGTVYGLARGAKAPNDGTLAGGAAWAAGTRAGGYGALSFNGSTAYVSVPNSAALSPTAAVSVSAWVYPTSSVTPVVAIAKDSDTNGRSWTLDLYAGGFPVARFYVNGGTVLAFGNATVPLNAWTHLAGTYDGNTIKLYVNGNQDASASGATAITAGTSTVQIGAREYSSSRSFFTGRIDGAAVWARALSAAEVAAVYAEGLAGNPNRWNWRPARYGPASAAPPVGGAIPLLPLLGVG